jgi:hypothetical protein
MGSDGFTAREEASRILVTAISSIAGESRTGLFSRPNVVLTHVARRILRLLCDVMLHEPTVEARGFRDNYRWAYILSAITFG